MDLFCLLVYLLILKNTEHIRMMRMIQQEGEIDDCRRKQWSKKSEDFDKRKWNGT